MRAIIKSVSPEVAYEIMEGRCTYLELARIPRLEPPFKCFIYEKRGRLLSSFWAEDTPDDYRIFVYRGSGKVIGEFTCDELAGGLLHITNLLIYKEARCINSFVNSCKCKYYDALEQGIDVPSNCLFCPHSYSNKYTRIPGGDEEFGCRVNGLRPIASSPDDWCYTEVFR